MTAATAALDAALDMQIAVDISQVNGCTDLQWVTLAEEQKELIREAVRAAVEEERERCAGIVESMDFSKAGHPVSAIMIRSLPDIATVIREAPR